MTSSFIKDKTMHQYAPEHDMQNIYIMLLKIFVSHTEEGSCRVYNWDNDQLDFPNVMKVIVQTH